MELKNNRLDELRQKAEELKVQDVFNEIVDFLSEIKPMLEEINLSITDNVRRIPGASKKLSKVTEATEYATTDIMNTVDRIFTKIDKVTGMHAEINDFMKAEKEQLLDVLKKSRKALADKNANAELLYNLDKEIKKIEESPGKEKFDPEKFNIVFGEISDELNAIMISLQVQDITSQQIAAVNHLLEVIVQRLSKILAKLGSKEMTKILNIHHEENVSELHRKIAFDPNAIDSYGKDDDRQCDVDELIKKFDSGTLSEEDLSGDPVTMSQDEIDALMNATSPSKSDSKDKEDDAHDDFDDDDEKFSQDDIDALFNNQ